MGDSDTKVSSCDFPVGMICGFMTDFGIVIDEGVSLGERRWESAIFIECFMSRGDGGVVGVNALKCPP